MVANRVTNRAEFERLLKGRTGILVDGLEGLKNVSPLNLDGDDQ